MGFRIVFPDDLVFFAVPVAVAVSDTGYQILSTKTQTGLMIDIQALLEEENV